MTSLVDTSTDTRVVSPTLVGRAAELRVLVHTLTSSPAVAVVVGEAGIGKSRLVAELTRELADRRFVSGWCRRIREPFPLGPMIDAVRSLGDDLAGARLSPVAGALRPLLPEIAHLLPPRPDPLGDRVGERHRVFRGLIEVLAALGPAVLVLEDLHWADELTVDFLSYLVAAPPPELSVVLTFRGEEVDPAVPALTAAVPPEVGRARIALAPLDAEQTGALAAAVLGTDRVSAEFAEYLCTRAAGLPFAVEELLALLRARNMLVRSPGGWARRGIDELDVPVRIRDSVLDRVARLAEDTRAVVRAAAVLQVPVRPAVLAGAAGVPPAALDPALASNLLTESADAVAFRHPLAAQAVYEDLPGALRRELHGRAAAALEALRPVPLGQLAHHLRHAGRIEEWALAAERAAAQAIELGDDAEAARLLREVLVTAPLEPDRKGRVAATLAQVASEALLDRQVLDLLCPMLDEDLSVPVRGELRFRLGLLINQLSPDDAHVFELMAGAAEDLDHRPDLKAWAMACLGAPLVPGVPVAERVRRLDRALDVLDQVDDRVFQVFLLGKIASFLASTGHPRWRSVAERMVARAGGAPTTRLELNAYHSVAAACCVLGDLATTRSLLNQALPAVSGSESRRIELRYEASSVLLDYSIGDWDGLPDRVATAIDELTSDLCTRNDVEAVATWLALARGELATGSTGLGPAVERWRTVGVDLTPIPLGALAKAAMADGDTPTALGCVDQVWTGARAKGIWAPVGQALPWLAEALVHAGQPDRAGELVDAYAAETRELDVPLAPVAVRHARGVLAGAATEAAADFLAAARLYDALPHPYLAALARESAASRLLPVADPAAEAHLLDAIGTYQRLGARWDEDRSTALARRHRVPLPARHRGGRRGYGADLSPREREVAELAASGRTNKEIAAALFLSAKTVDKHLSATLRKLRLRSRVELAGRFGGNGESSP